MFNNPDPQQAARDASAEAQRLAGQQAQARADGRILSPRPSRWGQSLVGISNLPGNPATPAQAQPVQVIAGQPVECHLFRRDHRLG